MIKTDGKLSYARAESETPLIEKTTHELLSTIAKTHPKNEALVACWQNRRFNYEQFHALCTRAAKAFIKLGVKKGDRVSILSTNNPEWAICQFALPMMGGVLVTVNPAFKEHELEYLLKDSGSMSLVMIKGFKQSDYLGMVNNICPEITASKPGHLGSKKLPGLKNVIMIGENQSGMFNWDEFMAMADDVSDDELLNRQSGLSAHDIVNMQYTSGTTGFPKGVCLTHHNILNNGFFVGETMHFTDQDRLCIPVPFFHCFGMVLSNLACVTHGATMVLPSEHFDALGTLKAVESERCTALHGVPTMFVAELAHPEFGKFNLSTLRTGIMAGAPCPVELMRQVLEKMNMKDVTICYGLTECSPVTNQTRISDPINLRVETVGQPAPHVEVRIVDPDNKVLACGQQGEVCARGYQVMKGYYNNFDATRETIDSEGWLHSGDLGVMDAKGYVRITGRIKDMIIRGGENVYPREIEEFLHTNPKVENVAVFGVPDDKFGEQIAAWIKLRKGSESTTDEMIDFCKGKIAHYKVPRYIKFVDDYPMTASGKIKKFVMRDIYAKELGAIK